jgi:hypothetical protein
MTRWTSDNWCAQGSQLELGALGWLQLTKSPKGWSWGYNHKNGYNWNERIYPDANAARRAAVSWLRRALQQAGKRVEVK